jgi:hypothetical protein
MFEGISHARMIVGFRKPELRRECVALLERAGEAD